MQTNQLTVDDIMGGLLAAVLTSALFLLAVGLPHVEGNDSNPACDVEGTDSYYENCLYGPWLPEESGEE